MMDYEGASGISEESIPCLEISDKAVFTQTPLVSVCMITYNHEPYISQAIEGVLQQKTDFPFELIIGEDCSTDRTREIVLKHQEKYPNIIRVLLSESNVGMHKNAKRVLDSCRGKYIAYCEGDDYWHNPQKLQLQIGFLENHPDYGMVSSNCHQFWVERGVLEKSVMKVSPDLNDGNGYLELLLGNRDVRTLTVCVRKDLLLSVLEKNPECTDTSYLMGDTQCCLEISRITRIKHLPESLATRNMLSESATQSRDANKILKFHLSCKRLLCHYLQKYECPKGIILTLKRRLLVDSLECSFQAMNAEVARNAIEELGSLGCNLSIKHRLLYYGSKNKVAHFMILVLRNMKLKFTRLR